MLHFPAKIPRLMLLIANFSKFFSIEIWDFLIRSEEEFSQLSGYIDKCYALPVDYDDEFLRREKNLDSRMNCNYNHNYN